MVKKIIICGGGPCGLVCAYLLTKKGHSVTIVERSSKLGGCWKVDWEDKLFTEHSPRVLSTNYLNFFKLLHELDIPIKLNGVYANTAADTTNKIMKFIKNNFSFLDFIKLGGYITLSLFGHRTNMTVQEWLNKVNLSKNGRFTIRIMCILFADIPKKVLFDIFIKAIYGNDSEGNLVQFKYSDRWIYLFEKKLKKLHVKILKNETVISLKSNDKLQIISCNTNKRIIYGDYFIITTPPNTLKTILDKSNKKLKANWMSWNKMKRWCDYSIYNSFSFQLHFENKIMFPKEWCKFCRTKWEIIVLPTSNFNKDFTRNHKIKTVWSCTIINLKPLKKLTSNQILNEAVRQLSKLSPNKSLKPTFVTISKDVIKTKNGWKSTNVGFVCTKLGTLHMQGKSSNLFSVGPHNTREISTLEVATNQAIIFCKKYIN